MFVVADVRGYSSFADQNGDEAAASLAQRFLDVATDVLNEHAGAVIDTRGDEVLAAFESPRAAIRASLALQARFLTETEQMPELPLPVGIGVDMGEVVVVADGYRGNAINVAARLCSIAPAGAVLATQAVVHVAQAMDGVQYVALPPAQLKGIADPVQYARIVDMAGDTATGFERLGRTHAAAPPSHARAPHRPTRTLVIAGAALISAVIIVAVVVGQGGAPRSVIVPDGLSSLSPTGEVLTSAPLSGSPAGVAGGFGSEWVTSTTTNQLYRIDWKTGAVSIIAVGHEPEGIAVGASAVWVADSGDGTVVRISPLTNTIVATVAVGTGPSSLSLFDNRLWVTDSLAASISEIDPTTNAVVKTVPTGPEPAGIAGGSGALWVADEGNGTVERLDPYTGQELSAPIPVGNGPTSVAFGDGAAWVTNSLDGSLARVDATNESVTTSPAGAGANGVAVAGNRIWVSNEDGGTMSEFSPAGVTVGTLAVRSAPTGVAYSDGRLWVASDGLGAEVHRGGVLAIDAQYLDGESDPTSIDPGSAYDAELWRLLIMTNDGLVGYDRVGGLEGGTLVPDLATFLPSPTDHGLTYTFQLRKGIRFSTDQPVVASDFRDALERAVRVGGGPIFYFLNVLVGGAKCTHAPATCSLANGIQADDRTGQVVFHLTRPDPDLLEQLALPVADAVPANTPVQLPTGGSVPATGPYQVLSYRPATGNRTGSLILVRNRFFHEWSAAAQPEGFPDRIVITTGLPAADEVRAVENGTVDAMWGVPSAREYAQMKSDYPSQVYLNSVADTSYFWLNTRVPPFSSLAARQAIEFAIDRRHLVAAQPAGTAPGSAITCQVLPPDFPSYQPLCPYTLDPSSTGKWTAPDLVTAQRLVGQSGMRGTVVTVASTPVFASLAQLDLLARTLRELGFVVRTRYIVNQVTYLNTIETPSPAFQIGSLNWESDYIGASDFFLPLLTCNSFVQSHSYLGFSLNPGAFCDPQVDQAIAQALAAQEANSGAAADDWAQVDRLVVDQAPWVSIANPQSIDFVSRRIGDYQYNPQFGELADLLWVH